MRHPHAILPALAILAALALPAPSRAADGADPEIQAIITSQIEAFGVDDGVKAESYASPSIRTLFPDAASFLGMVKQGYAPLIHPRSTHFEATVASGTGSVQHVTIVDKDGVVWTAVYTLEKVDGHWAISGCALVKSPETTA